MTPSRTLVLAGVVALTFVVGISCVGVGLLAWRGGFGGDSWSFGDLQAHFEQQGQHYVKLNSRRFPAGMWFGPVKGPVTPQNREERQRFLYQMEPTFDMNQDDGSFLVLRLDSPAEAAAEVARLRDREEVSCFAWRNFVFRSGPQTLARVRAMLPD